MADSDFTLADLTALKKAISQGVNRVQYQDKIVVYRSLDEMLKTLRMMEQRLGVKKSTLRLKSQTSKGLGC